MERLFANNVSIIFSSSKFVFATNVSVSRSPSSNNTSFSVASPHIIIAFGSISFRNSHRLLSRSIIFTFSPICNSCFARYIEVLPPPIIIASLAAAVCLPSFLKNSIIFSCVLTIVISSFACIRKLPSGIMTCSPRSTIGINTSHRSFPGSSFSIIPHKRLSSSIR